MESQVPDAPIDPPAPVSPSLLGTIQPGRLWTLSLVAAVLAGVAAWLVGEATLEYFVPPPKIVGNVNTPAIADSIVADRKNASLAHGVLGAVLGLALGLAGGLARRSPVAALASGIAGSLIGLGVALAASEAILPFYFQQAARNPDALTQDLILPLLVHAGVWAAIGAAGGISLGLGLGLKKQIVSAALSGLIGGALGACAYELIGALAFPSGRTSQLLASSWAPRLLGKLAVTLLATTLSVFAITSPARKKPAKVGA